MSAAAPHGMSASEAVRAAVVQSVSDAVVVAWCIVLTLVGTGVWSLGLHQDHALTVPWAQRW